MWSVRLNSFGPIHWGTVCERGQVRKIVAGFGYGRTHSRGVRKVMKIREKRASWFPVR